MKGRQMPGRRFASIQKRAKTCYRRRLGASQAPPIPLACSEFLGGSIEGNGYSGKCVRTCALSADSPCSGHNSG
jgi:hypothetical protein